MKALIDEQLSADIASLLRDKGHDVVAVTERDDLAGQVDRVIFEVSVTEGRVLITNNIKDFRPLAAEWLARGRSHPGLVLLPSKRTRTRAAVTALADAIDEVFAAHPDGLTERERWIGPLSAL